MESLGPAPHRIGALDSAVCQASSKREARRADERARDAELALKMALRAPWIQALSADNVTLSWTLEDPDTPLPVRVRLSLSLTNN